MRPGEGRTAEMGTGWAAGGAPGGRRRLGEVLVAGPVLTEAQLGEALRVQREDKGRRRRLGEIITALAWPTRCRSPAPSPTSSACPSWTWAACPSPTRPWPCCPQRRPAARGGAGHPGPRRAHRDPG